MIAEVTSVDEFRNFLGHARCGDTCIYHRGNLTYDMRTNRMLKAVVAEVRKACADGIITLTQRRIADFLYEYRATLRVAEVDL